MVGDAAEEQVRVVSRAMVRPAQPTPPHPFFLSCLDIFWQDIPYNRRLLFYDSTAVSGFDGRAALMQQLKSSLALCLVHYYPWCGRFAKGPLPPHRLFIDCNDAGVEFVEAYSDLPLSSFATDRFQMKPSFLHLSQFPDHKGDSLYHSPLLSIQATLFSDGGLTLGIALSHIVADGQSFWNFMVSWGECSRGVPLSLLPLHSRERLAVPDPSPEKATDWTISLQTKELDEKDNGSTSTSVGTATPQVENDPSANGDNANKDLLTHGSKKSGVDKDGKSGTEPGDKDNLNLNEEKESTGGTKVSSAGKPSADPLVQCLLDLPSLAVKKLKYEAGEGFTSYEVICAHFWQRVTIARQTPRCDSTHFAVLANYRTRVTPPLSPAYFGNVITFCLARSTAGKIGSDSLSATAHRIHKIIAEAREDRLLGFMHWLETHDNRIVDQSSAPKGQGLNVASSPRFPAYQVDFGWGTPVAIRPVKAGREAELVLFGGRPGSNQGDVEICTALPSSVLRRLLEDPVFLAKPPYSPFPNE